MLQKILCFVLIYLYFRGAYNTQDLRYFAIKCEKLSKGYVLLGLLGHLHTFWRKERIMRKLGKCVKKYSPKVKSCSRQWIQSTVSLSFSGINSTVYIKGENLLGWKTFSIWLPCNSDQLKRTLKLSHALIVPVIVFWKDILYLAFFFPGWFHCWGFLFYCLVFCFLGFAIMFLQ